MNPLYFCFLHILEWIHGRRIPNLRCRNVVDFIGSKQHVPFYQVNYWCRQSVKLCNIANIVITYIALGQNLYMKSQLNFVSKHDFTNFFGDNLSNLLNNLVCLKMKCEKYCFQAWFFSRCVQLVFNSICSDTKIKPSNPTEYWRTWVIKIN